MREWQYMYNGRPVGFIRYSWDAAVNDAIRARQCVRIGPRTIHTMPGATIVRLDREKPNAN